MSKEAKSVEKKLWPKLTSAEMNSISGTVYKMQDKFKSTIKRMSQGQYHSLLNDAVKSEMYKVAASNATSLGLRSYYLIKKSEHASAVKSDIAATELSNAKTSAAVDKAKRDLAKHIELMVKLRDKAYELGSRILAARKRR